MAITTPTSQRRADSDVINSLKLLLSAIGHPRLYCTDQQLNKSSSRFGPSALTATNEEGIEKVRREKFGFILPDTIGDYVAQRLPCDLVAVGRFLDRRGYAIALPKNSRHTELLDRAIRQLRRTGFLDRLKAQWWHGRGECRRSGPGGARISRMYGSVYASSGHHPAAADRVTDVRRRSVAVRLVLSFGVVAVVSAANH